jgi:hypothetical protein
VSGNLAHAVKRSNTVRLIYACGKVIVRSGVLDPGKLLQGILAPILIQIKNGIFVLRASLYLHGIYNLTIGGVIKIILVSLTVSLAEVFTNLHGDGEQKVLFVEYRAPLNDGSVAACSHNVYLSVDLITSPRIPGTERDPSAPSLRESDLWMMWMLGYTSNGQSGLSNLCTATRRLFIPT